MIMTWDPVRKVLDTGVLWVNTGQHLGFVFKQSRMASSTVVPVTSRAAQQLPVSFQHHPQPHSTLCLSTPGQEMSSQVSQGGQEVGRARAVISTHLF